MQKLIDRSVADAVKLLRAASGLTFGALAERSKVSKPHIHQIENARKAPSRNVVRCLDLALNAGGLLLALYAEVDPVKRRALLATVATLAAGSSEYVRLIEGLGYPRPNRAGMSDVEAAAQAVEFCTALDLRHGGGSAAAPGQAMLGWAVRLLDAQMSDEVRLRLCREVAALADRVAWASYDAGQDTTSERLYGVALKIARTGNDPNLFAHILIDASTRHSHNGHHGHAADLLSASLDSQRLMPTVEANVRLTYARHLANQGQPRQAITAINKAVECAHRESGMPDWSKPFLANPGHLISVAARSYLFAGQYDQAITGFTSAIAQLPPARGRGRAYNLCLLTIAYAQAGYRDVAARTAHDAIAACDGLKSMRVAGHLHTLGGLAKKWNRDLSHIVNEASRRVEPSVQ